MEIEKKLAWLKICFIFFGFVWATFTCLALLPENNPIMFALSFIVSYIMYIILCGIVKVMREIKNAN